MNEIIYPNYNECIVNTVSSILNYYDVKSNYDTLPCLDKFLGKKYKNIVMMIFDGMGVDMLENNISENSFLRYNIEKEIKSVYPCTTTAAMTSYYSGLAPIEHGWLGWSLYFKEYGRCIDAFLNDDSYSGDNVGELSAAWNLLKYKSIYEKIHAKTDGNIKMYTVNPSYITVPEGPNINIKANNIKEVFSSIKNLCIDNKSNEQKFITSYWTEPDHTMHEEGCYTDNVKDIVHAIDYNLEKMCLNLKDTLVIVSADHGLIDVSKEIFINEIPEIDECLIMPPSIDKRALTFFIKTNMSEEFASRFISIFKNEFILFSKKEVYELKLFGTGTQHKKVDDFLGDYLAVATSDLILNYKTLNSKKHFVFKAHHTGFTKKEMLIPLIIIDK